MASDIKTEDVITIKVFTINITAAGIITDIIAMGFITILMMAMDIAMFIIMDELMVIVDLYQRRGLMADLSTLEEFAGKKDAYTVIPRESAGSSLQPATNSPYLPNPSPTMLSDLSKE
ncbi:MAG: hypothetical protein WAW86_00245 [Gammaproteobacteria bacterium]